MAGMDFKPADYVRFGPTTYMLIERTFYGHDPVWLAVEPFNPNAKPRLLVECDLKPINADAERPVEVR